MKQVGKYNFIGECDCGHKHDFKKNEINYQKSDASVALLKTIYICPDCKTSYDGIFMAIKNKNNKLGFSPTGTLVVLLILGGFIFGGYKVLSPIFNTSPSNTDINNATNRELNDFFKWDHKHQQQKRENQPAFNNGN